MRPSGRLGWVAGIGAGAVAVVCCALGPAVVAGSVPAAAAGLLTGSGLVALAAFGVIALVFAAVVRRRSRLRADLTDEGPSDALDAGDGALGDRPPGTVGP